jgi:hypothetical protein
VVASSILPSLIAAQFGIGSSYRKQGYIRVQSESPSAEYAYVTSSLAGSVYAHSLYPR